MKDHFAKLKSFYGNHTVVANKLGITARYYRTIRSGRIKAGDTLKKYILELSRQIDLSQKAA